MALPTQAAFDAAIKELNDPAKSMLSALMAAILAGDFGNITLTTTGTVSAGLVQAATSVQSPLYKNAGTEGYTGTAAQALADGATFHGGIMQSAD